MNKKIAIITIEFTSSQGPNINTTWSLINRNPAFAGAKRDGKAITFTLPPPSEELTYSLVEWLQGKIKTMGAEFSIRAEEYRHVKTAYSFSNLKEKE